MPIKKIAQCLSGMVHTAGIIVVLGGHREKDQD